MGARGQGAREREGGVMEREARVGNTHVHPPLFH